MSKKKSGDENTPHQNRWGKMPIDPKVKNPSGWHETELIRDGLSMPPPMGFDGIKDVNDPVSEDRNKRIARPNNKRERGDKVTSAYMPRPGDDMPKPFQNHSGMKKPSLVLRFTQKSGGRFYWKDGMNSQREIWVLPTQYGFKATFMYQNTGIASGYGKTALESVQNLLGRVVYYSADAACNLPLWTLKKKVIEKKVYLEGQTDVYAVTRYSVPQVSVFKTVHILLAHNPRSPLPSVYQEHLEVRHMRGGYEWEYVSVEPPTEAQFCAGVSTGKAKDEHEPQIPDWEKERGGKPQITPTPIPKRHWHDDKRYL